MFLETKSTQSPRKNNYSTNSTNKSYKKQNKFNYTPTNSKFTLNFKDSKTVYNEFHNEENSTNCKSFNTQLVSSSKKQFKSPEDSLVKPFGFNLQNIKANKLNNNENLNLNFALRSINLDTKPKKKVLLSTDEIVMERIEREKLEIEKLKRTNRENLEKMFPIGSGNSLLLGKKRDSEGNFTDTAFNSNKKSSNQKDLINKLPLFNQTDSSSTAMNLEDEFLSLTDTISKLSVTNSPDNSRRKELSRGMDTFANISLFDVANNERKANELKEKNKRKEDKQREIKKHVAYNKMNLSFFNKKTVTSKMELEN